MAPGQKHVRLLQRTGVRFLELTLGASQLPMAPVILAFRSTQTYTLTDLSASFKIIETGIFERTCGKRFLKLVWKRICTNYKACTPKPKIQQREGTVDKIFAEQTFNKELVSKIDKGLNST